jgi:hypothetical protein
VPPSEAAAPAGWQHLHEVPSPKALNLTRGRIISSIAFLVSFLEFTRKFARALLRFILIEYKFI